MEDAIALIIGIVALPLGISFLLHGEDWAGWLRHVRKLGRPAALMMGYLHLGVGAVILAFHWKWTGLPLVTTLLGAKAVGEGLTYMLCPGCMLRMLEWYDRHHRNLFRMAGIVTLIIAVAVLTEWRQTMHHHCNWSPCFDYVSSD